MLSVLCLWLVVASPLQGNSANTLDANAEAHADTVAREREAEALETAVFDRMKSQEENHVRDTITQVAQQGFDMVKQVWNEFNPSQLTDYLYKKFNGESTTSAAPQADLEQSIESKEHSQRVTAHRAHSTKKHHDFEKSPLSDLTSPEFRRYPCTNQTQCSDQCYQKIVSDIMAAPTASSGATANWVMCEFLTAGTGNPCGPEFPEITPSRYQRGRIEAQDGDSSDIIATMERWLEILRSNCQYQPLVSKVSVTVAGTDFDFVVEMRRDCKARIYQSSPNGTYSLRTWLKAPNQQLNILDLEPYSTRIVHAAHRSAKDEMQAQVEAAQNVLDQMDPAVKQQILTTRKTYGSGAPLSIEAFTQYIVTLKDAYVVFCDSLHNSNRNFWQTVVRGVACLTGDSRTKPRAAHLFTNIFGENLDRCSPSFCQFTFDVFSYDDSACAADIAQEAAAKNAVRKSSPRISTRIPVQWQTDEDSPFAEDTDATEWKFQNTDVTLQRWVSTSFALTHRAVQYFKDQALGLAAPRSWNIRSLGELDDKRTRTTKKWQKEAAERIANGAKGTTQIGSEKTKKRAQVWYDPATSEKEAELDSGFVDDDEVQEGGDPEEEEQPLVPEISVQTDVSLADKEPKDGQTVPETQKLPQKPAANPLEGKPKKIDPQPEPETKPTTVVQNVPEPKAAPKQKDENEDDDGNDGQVAALD
eukprot:c8482_g1_i1.p1 GENE.c8482_g1_i1~~c8482_g1_i1.p1  ORF type:complete len:699 (-),score=207.56 c8482_g1_i1:79-2175(-)